MGEVFGDSFILLRDGCIYIHGRTSFPEMWIPSSTWPGIAHVIGQGHW